MVEKFTKTQSSPSLKRFSSERETNQTITLTRSAIARGGNETDNWPLSPNFGQTSDRQRLSHQRLLFYIPVKTSKERITRKLRLHSIINLVQLVEFFYWKQLALEGMEDSNSPEGWIRKMYTHTVLSGENTNCSKCGQTENQCHLIPSLSVVLLDGIIYCRMDSKMFLQPPCLIGQYYSDFLSRRFGKQTDYYRTISFTFL